MNLIGLKGPLISNHRSRLVLRGKGEGQINHHKKARMCSKHFSRIDALIYINIYVYNSSL